MIRSGKFLSINTLGVLHPAILRQVNRLGFVPGPGEFSQYGMLGSLPGLRNLQNSWEFRRLGQSSLPEYLANLPIGVRNHADQEGISAGSYDSQIT